jgi:[FeFe] hydrogenase (group B1/B3)
MAREFETKVQELKHSVLREVSALAFDGNLTTGILDIPEKIIPGPEPHYRCCIYKERAIINDRVKMAMGGDMANPGVVEVIPTACDECPVTAMEVGPSCRGCLANRCRHACPVGAITMENHKAKIDHSKCIVCGRCMAACPYTAIVKNQRPCERSCPTNAISMRESDHKASIDPSKCVSCGTCTYACPFGAIMDKSWIVQAINMLKGSKQWKYHVYAAVAPAVAGQYPGATLGKIATGLKQLGFYGVREVAEGADMTAHTEAQELAEKGSLYSSCCPAFVSYVEMHHPDQAQKISSTPSPMVMIARRIKEQDHDARVIFIGPCVAKKHEFRLGKTRGAVDCVLTFEELDALFDSRNIDVSALEETPLDDATGFARGFAASGGVSAAVAQSLKEQGIDFEVKPVACAGLTACNTAILKDAHGRPDGNFIEGMACDMGCISGAGCMVRTPKNKASLTQYAKAATHDCIADVAVAPSSEA